MSRPRSLAAGAGWDETEEVYSRAFSSTLRHLDVPEAADLVVIDQADRLHERVADGRTDEHEPAAHQVAAQRDRFRGGSGQLVEALPGIDFRARSQRFTLPSPSANAQRSHGDRAQRHPLDEEAHLLAFLLHG